MNGNKLITGSTQKYAVPQIPKVGQGGWNVQKQKPDLRIRKLTPKECWRLMGFDDEDFYSAKYGFQIDRETAMEISSSVMTKVKFELKYRKQKMSNTQLYKQAGNSIVVNVLEKIFKNLLCS